MEETLGELGERAVDLVREQYDAVASVANLDLKAINRPRPQSMRYRSHSEIVREWLHAAGAVATFAVNLGLITPDEARQAILDFQASHPDLVRES